MPASVEFVSLYFEGAAVCALAHVRKTSGAAGLFRGDILAVLYHRNGLKVVRLVERTVDSPVVRNGNLLPSLCSPGFMSLAEFPVLEYGFRTLSLCKGSGCCK